MTLLRTLTSRHMSFYAIRENKIPAKISDCTVFNLLRVQQVQSNIVNSKFWRSDCFFFLNYQGCYRLRRRQSLKYCPSPPPHTKKYFEYLLSKQTSTKTNDLTTIIVNEYDQEIPRSQTADNPVAPRGRAAQPSQDTRKTN